MIILDLDGCIANDAWRIPRIAWQHADPSRRYHDYHSLAPWDESGNRELFAGRAGSIAILTARPVMFRAATVEWLARAGVRWEHLIMRNDGDHMPSAALKSKQLDWLLNHYGVELADIEKAYDDRPEVIEMYTQRGLRAERKWLHEVCAYTRPAR